ncbi:hypothetical protein COCON_G00099920 [Conger conger]|uniref:Uncharacterized protein n=1 Tax=Conger conger TaxID=82655 RepID=A0A9Q1DMN8_CONCO|nr:hypothetical protein COCON_G00099920 [Conger conger]
MLKLLCHVTSRPEYIRQPACTCVHPAPRSVSSQVTYGQTDIGLHSNGPVFMQTGNDGESSSQMCQPGGHVFSLKQAGSSRLELPPPPPPPPQSVHPAFALLSSSSSSICPSSLRSPLLSSSAICPSSSTLLKGFTRWHTPQC